VVELELETPGLELFVTPMSDTDEPEYRAKTTSRFVADTQALLAVNASYFVPFKSGAQGGDDFVPKAGEHTDAVGTVIAAGHRVSSVSSGVDPRVNAILCVYPSAVSIRRGEVCGDKVIEAVAAGPLLLAQGAVQSFDRADPRYARKRHPRTSFGLSENGKIGWLVVVDGRQSVTSEGATLSELTAFYRSLGATDAINLDGGGSTTLVIADQDGQPKVLNSPIHTGIPGRERPVANHLGLRQSMTRDARAQTVPAS
jgi:exopolysaccharide biosynthesis protein